MNNSNVTKFLKDANFYLELSRSHVFEDDFISAIKYARMSRAAAERDKNEVACVCNNYYLGQVYSMIEDYSLSNYYFFGALSNKLLVKVTYKWLGENYICMGLDDIGKYYINKCLEVEGGSEELDKQAKEILESIKFSQEYNAKKFIVINGGKGKKEVTPAFIKQLVELADKEDNKQIINLCNENGNYENNILRGFLVTAYLVECMYKEALNVLDNYSKDNLTDLANRIIVYKETNNEECYKRTMQKVIKYETSSREETFNQALILANNGEAREAVRILDKYFDFSPGFDFRLQMVYCMLCLNAKLYEKAKQRLIDLKTYDPQQSYIINKLLEICKNKEEYEFSSRSVYSNKILNEVKYKIKNLVTLSDDRLREAFNKNQDFFYFLESYKESNLKNLLFLRLSKISSKAISAFFRFLFLKSNARTNFKLQLAENRLVLDSVSFLELTKDEIFISMDLPNKKLLKKYTPNLFEATKLCWQYLLHGNNTPDYINLRIPIMRIDAKNIDVNINPNIIAGYVIWSNFASGKIKELKRICSHFNITKEQIYNFALTYKLPIV